jgi:hypothetical protein
MLRPSRYILIDRGAWSWVHKALKQNGGLRNISTKNIADMVEKPPHPPKNTIKKLKNELKFKKKPTRQPLKICESVTLTKYFFLFGLMVYLYVYIILAFAMKSTFGENKLAYTVYQTMISRMKNDRNW